LILKNLLTLTSFLQIQNHIILVDLYAKVYFEVLSRDGEYDFHGDKATLREFAFRKI
jgi:hypothetical protein